MTNSDQNRSETSDEPLRGDSGSTDSAVVNRRTCLKLAGVAATSLAGCAGKGGPTTGQSAIGSGYGGGPAVTDQLAAVDMSEVAELGAVANSVDDLGLDAPTSTRLGAGSADLFSFEAGVGTDLTVVFDPAEEMGATALGVFDPDGNLVTQAYARADAPVYIPEEIATAGTHYVQVMDVSQTGGEYSLSVSTESTTTQSQSPYEGEVATIPGRIQAQNFDVGGQDVAYHDTSSGNEYDTSYRDGDVDIRKTKDQSGTYNIGYFQQGEWLEYTADVSPGTYDVHVRVATPRSNRELKLTLGDQDLGTVAVPDTGDWTSWETVTLEGVDVSLDERTTLRVEALNSGIDFNWVEFEAVELKGAYNDTPATIPGRIEAQNYDTGGEGVSYHDTTSGNEYDTTYRDGDVDIRKTKDETGTYNVGYFEQGEWLEFTADVSPGTYDVDVRVATTKSDRQLRLTLDGTELGIVDVPNTGSWMDWQTATLEGVSVDADGEHVLRVEALDSGIDFNWVEFKATENAPFDGVPTLPGRVQAQNYDLGGEGVSYHDTSSGNEYDTSYRDGDVDIRKTKDQSGTYNVGYFQDGEWLEYTVDVSSGTYDVNVRVATPRNDRQLQISLDGQQLGTIDVPNTGGWTNWQTATLEGVSVDADGEHVLQVKAVGSGIDFNWIEVVESSTTTDSDSDDDDFGEDGYGMGGYGGTQS